MAAPGYSLSTLQQASEMIRSGSVSPVELTTDCLDRISKLDPSLNSFITVMGDQALARARELEIEQQRGDLRGPLHGIPIGLKDLIDTEGVRTTAASAIFADRVPDADAEVVRRLHSAGAILIGKLNMQEFAYGATSVPTHFGPVRNPWSLDRIAGGSSGGSAAAVAAGLCYGALGSDTGGSIRQPAAYCGIVGLKPTFGRVSTRGVIPLSWSMDNLGPMCRTVSDTALLLNAIAGYDPGDVSSIDEPAPDYFALLPQKTHGLRLGVVRPRFFDGVDPEIQSIVEAAIDDLGALTSEAREITLPAYGQIPVINAEAYAFHGQYLAEKRDLYQPFTRDRLERAVNISTQTYILARRELDVLRRAVRQVFSDIDIIVTPTAPVGASTIDEAKAEVPPSVGVSPSLRNTLPFNFYALPTISVPCGFTASGMPVGMQIAGAPWAEAQVLAVAYAYEQSTEWHKRVPALLSGSAASSL